MPGGGTTDNVVADVYRLKLIQSKNSGACHIGEPLFYL